MTDTITSKHHQRGMWEYCFLSFEQGPSTSNGGTRYVEKGKSRPRCLTTTAPSRPQRSSQSDSALAGCCEGNRDVADQMVKLEPL